MASFQEVLLIAKLQAAEVAIGDLEAAVARLAGRGLLLQATPPPQAVDADVIREIMRLDRYLSAAIRERMIAISEEAKQGQRGQRALQSYGHAPPPRSRMLDAVG